MATHDDEMHQIRRKTEEIIQRLQHDAGFRQQVKADPEGVLRAAGLPNRHMADLVEEFNTSGKPGYLRPKCTVCSATCIKETTECTNSYLV